MTTAHPAKYSKQIKPIIERWVGTKRPALDPLAGIGTSGIPNVIHGEIEWDWASECPLPTYVGDATQLPFRDCSIAVWFSSPCYGNRMSDHHDAKEKCKACKGKGGKCKKCNGLGRRIYKRNTYKHMIGHDLHSQNAGAIPWGPRYRSLHKKIYKEAWRVIEDGGWLILNVSDFIKNGQRVRSSKWHCKTLQKIGFCLIDHDIAFTPRNRQGANRELRVPYENIYLFQKTA